MSIECGECERELRGGHAAECSRRVRLRVAHTEAAEAMRQRLLTVEWEET